MIPLYTGRDAEEALAQLTQSRQGMDEILERQVKDILSQVRQDGDDALKRLAQRFQDPAPTVLLASDPTIQTAIERIPAEIKHILEEAAGNIRTFAQAVMDNLQPVSLDRGGFQVGMNYRPVERVACYVPGGRYPLPSTALMTALTAHVAGVSDISIVSPSLPETVLYAGTLAGVQRFYQLGGAQAVAALAYGTETIPAVDMLVGPGNAYVTEAKRQLQGVIGIDMLAGPSEVAIIADAAANPNWVALDLLAQAEHDPDSRVYLLTDSLPLAQQVIQAMARALDTLALPAFLKESLPQSGAFVLPSLEACVEASNRLAPEHVELQVKNPQPFKDQLKHYGALFLGYNACVPMGDYMAGPNHTLPTGRAASFTGGLSPLTFLRPQSWLAVDSENTTLVRSTQQFSVLEGLTGHAEAAGQRIGHIL